MRFLKPFGFSVLVGIGVLVISMLLISNWMANNSASSSDPLFSLNAVIWPPLIAGLAFVLSLPLGFFFLFKK